MLELPDPACGWVLLSIIKDIRATGAHPIAMDDLWDRIDPKLAKLHDEIMDQLVELKNQGDVAGKTATVSKTPLVGKKAKTPAEMAKLRAEAAMLKGVADKGIPSRAQ
jgi:hypothetical protein